MSTRKIKPPKELKRRLKAVAKAHDFKNVDAVVDHFVTKGLAQYEQVDPNDDLGTQLDVVTVEMGYSSVDELIEHLLLRGLDAYEKVDDDPKKLEERLRGLGYIE